MARNVSNARAPKGLSSDRREGFVRAATKLLRRKGALAITDLLALLGAQGLSTIEALSVVNHGFSVRLLVRDREDPGAIAAGPASLPPASRAVTSVVLQPATTRAPDKRRSHRRKASVAVAIET